jgi:4-hydroxybenzoate polyprenyltransferase/phosphoserine phosphatase
MSQVIDSVPDDGPQQKSNVMPAADASTLALPLCVDLDGTLIRSDMLHEGLFALAGDPGIVDCLPQLFRGRAAFKQRVAERAPMDPAILPYNEQFLTFLRAQKAAGRYLVLATAADGHVARRIAEHLGLFDEVIASDGKNNLKGAAKGQALVARFGAKGFDYAGNASSDLPIWREARSAIAVNAPGRVLGRLRGFAPVELAIDDRAPLLVELVRAMRPHQWVKNILAFVPIVTAQALSDPSAWLDGFIMFAAFCATASGIYLINDLLDIAADRAHPRKRLRPFARGAIAMPVGMMTTILLLAIGIGLASLVHVIPIVVAYAVMSISYSFKLKELPLVDVFMLAALYTIRLFGGGEATGHALSLWLLGFSSFLFLSLALLKRVEEMMSMVNSGNAKAMRRGYTPADTTILQMLGIAATFASAIVLALFVQNEAVARHYASPTMLWFVVPLMLFWQCRMWLSGTRGQMHHDPIVYAAHDRISWAIGIAMLAVLAAAKSTILH